MMLTSEISLWQIWCHWKIKPKWIIWKKNFSKSWKTDPEKNEDENFIFFVYLVYDLENSTIETSIFSDYENITIFRQSISYVMLYYVCKNKRFLERNGGLYYNTNNWKSKSVIKKYGCKLMTRGWDMFYEQLFLLSIADHLFYNR